MPPWRPSLPQSATAALFYLLRIQASALTKVLRLRPVGRRAILYVSLGEKADVVAYALVVVHAPIIGTGSDALGSPLCQLGRWFWRPLLPHSVNVKVRIVSLAYINCLLFSGADVCQLVTHNVTIRALKTTGDDELSLLHNDQLSAKM